MKKLLKKDKQARKEYGFNEVNQIVSRYLFRYFTSLKNLTDNQRRIILKFFFKKFSLYKSKTKIVRRCVITNRSRSSTRLTLMSRIKLREKIRDKQFKAFEKAIW